MFRRIAVIAGFAGVLLLLSVALSHSISSQTLSGAGGSEVSRAVQAPSVRGVLRAGSRIAAIQIDYPQTGSIFPREITAPTFIWHDGNASSVEWHIDITFADGEKGLHIRSGGEQMQIGAIDPRCVAGSNRPPALSDEQASAHIWEPGEDMWALIKQHTLDHAATVKISGLDQGGQEVSRGRSTLSTSRDAVDGQIFYRDVPLMPSEGKKGIVQPLSPSLLYLINWRIRDIGKPESRIVMSGLHTCANCHSFSRDGKTMGMDVDGPANDKGLYAIVPVEKRMSIRNEDTVSWNADLRVGQSRVGFMSQVSPDGRYVLSTFAGKDQDIPSSYFVVNFKDYGFLQVFYPTRGILAWYNRATGRRQPLPGADDPQYVQTDGAWSPDGKYVVFARAKAKDPDQPGQTMPAAANDSNETQIQYDLYRVPFNEGKGGKAEPIAGASNNGMSNSFPKISPDGRWIVFVKARNGQLMRPDSELYIVPAAGGVARRMNCNTSRMNSWHSFSPNGRWLVFSSKSRSPYTQMFLTHIDAKGNDSPAIYVDNSTAANRAVNIPEFVNVASGGLENIDMPASDFYRVVDEAMDLQGKGDNAGALKKWQDALAMDPNDARANNGIGIVLSVTGKPEEAISYFQKAGRIQSDFFEAYYNLGIVLAKLNRFDEAIEAWRNTVRIRPEFAQGHENLGFALYVRGRFDQSIAELRLALKQEPDRPLALNLAASLLATCPDGSIRNGDEALTLAQRAAEESERKDPGTLDTLSAAYAEVGNFAEAVQTEEAALTESAKDGNAGLETILRRHLVRYESKEPIRTPQDFVAY